VADYVAADDHRLPGAVDSLGRPVKSVILLGGYATALTSEDLAAAPAGDGESDEGARQPGDRPS